MTSRLCAVVELHALLEAVGNGALAASGGLGEGSRATEGAGTSTVADTDDADVGGHADLAVAGHTSGHLDLDGEVGVGGEGQTLDAEARDVSGDLSALESLLLGAAGGAVDIGGHGTGAILVDLAEGHGDGAVVGAGGHALGGTHTSSGGDAGLGGTVLLVALVLATAAEEAGETLASVELGALHVGNVVLDTGAGCGSVVLGGGSTTHEVVDHHGGVNGAVALSAAKRADLTRGDLAVTDNGSVGLGAAAVGRAVTGSSISD